MFLPLPPFHSACCSLLPIGQWWSQKFYEAWAKRHTNINKINTMQDIKGIVTEPPNLQKINYEKLPSKQLL